jgi:hypothetical protein
MINHLLPLFPELRHLCEPSDRNDANDTSMARDGAARERTHVAFARLVAAVSTRSHPLVLALDDCHWMDQSSLELIQFLVLDADLASLGVIVSFRPYVGALDALDGAEQERRGSHSAVNVPEMHNVARLRALYATMRADRRYAHCAVSLVLSTLTRDSFVDIIQVYRFWRFFFFCVTTQLRLTATVHCRIVHRCNRLPSFISWQPSCTNAPAATPTLHSAIFTI